MLLGLVSDVITLFFHTKAIALLWAIIAYTYLRLHGHKPIGGKFLLRWMDDMYAPMQ